MERDPGARPGVHKDRITLNITEENKEWAKNHMRNISVFLDQKIDEARRAASVERVKRDFADCIKGVAADLSEEGEDVAAEALLDVIPVVLRRVDF